MGTILEVTVRLGTIKVGKRKSKVKKRQDEKVIPREKWKKTKGK